MITLNNGETVTINNHFDSDHDYAMNQIIFADGTVFSTQDIRDKTVSDMKASGIVTGSELLENYVHALGDGSYRITDYDPGSNSSHDRFMFTDVNVDDVTFSYGPSQDLVMTLSNGETVTINNYFDTDGDYRIEEIRFADGNAYDLAGVQNKITQNARPEPNNGDAIDLTSELRDIATVTSSSSHSHGENDELIDGLVSEDNFASTNSGATEWQKLDLGSEYSVNSIELTNRVIDDQYASRLDGAVVSLLDSDGNTIHTFDPISSATSGSTHLLEIGEFKTVQSVLISHSNQYLSVAELKVFGTSSNIEQSTVGDDILVGTDNTDVFVFDDSFGSDQVTGFEDGTDLLRFEISEVAFEDLVFTSSAGNTEITVADQGVITLAGVDSSLLTEEDFVFL